MFKLNVIFITLWAVSQAAYISRMTALNRFRGPSAFRPGVVLQRPIYPQRIMPPATRRAPYIMYRNTPHPQIHNRFAMKHINPGPTRNTFSPWKTTRLPIPQPTPEYEIVRPSVAPAPPPVISAEGTGAIHTIPAPNLSLSEKPIVVVDNADISRTHRGSEAPKSSYEVTEKFTEHQIYHQSNPSPKIEPPIGFSKASTFSAAELQNIVRHNAALQLASEYGLPAIQLSQPTVQLPPQPTIAPHQQYSIQSFNPNQYEFMQRGAEGFIIPPNALYQSDPMFLQKLQSQILQQFPAVEFIPYTPDIPPQIPTQPPEPQSEIYLLQNEIIKQAPSSFVPSENQKNVVQRETQESSIMSIVPQAFTVSNISENLIETTTTESSQNVTYDLITVETQAPTTTAKNIIETNTEDQKSTPIYYAQIGQSIGNVIANGFYSALNDMRAASLDEEKSESKVNMQNITSTTTTTTTTSTAAPTTTQREMKAVYIPNEKENRSLEDLKNIMGAPFEKTAESVNVAYTILRASEKQPKVNKDGEVFAGQLVEASVSEDQDFNKERANLSRRTPLRLFAVTEKKASEASPQRTVVKAKIPPKSKLTFDDKTGEPVLRIYASYVDNPLQKEYITSKLSNMKHVREAARKQDNFEWKAESAKGFEKASTSDSNQQFGLKLISRSDDNIPIFEDYE